MDRDGKTVCSGEALSLKEKFTISNTEASSMSICISKHCLCIRGLGILDNKYGLYLWLKGISLSGQCITKDLYLM